METVQPLIKEICPTSTQVWVKKGALLVDVRESSEVATLRFNVPNIINIPLSDFEKRYSEIPKNQDLVIVCRGGGKSLLATSFLLNHGYDPAKVVNMKHGLIRWAQKGFPTIGDTSTVLDSDIPVSCCDNSTNHSTKSSCCSTSKNGSSSCC
jgi:rhodanese-related sulfurtransferase